MRHHAKPFDRLKPLQFVGGSLLAALYFFTATPLAPGLTVLLASADSSHHAGIYHTSRGAAVVLRHDCSMVATHRHSLVARMLTLVALRTTAAQPDHVIQFTANPLTGQAAIALTAPAPGQDLVAPSGHASIFVPLSVAPEPPVSPPRVLRELVNVRSTVLLI